MEMGSMLGLTVATFTAVISIILTPVFYIFNFWIAFVDLLSPQNLCSFNPDILCFFSLYCQKVNHLKVTFP